MPRSMMLAIAVTSLLVPSIMVACEWDHDTLKMERSRFPTALELMTGKFLRHGPEFYQWRIDDRLRRLQTDPHNLNLLDDLAVAYDKTGQQSLAIATAERSLRIQPNRYETLANLGTFHFHAGNLRQGLPFIVRAIQINPNAHFGREKYQKLLVEYVLEQQRDGKTTFPLANTAEDRGPSRTFDHFLQRQLGDEYDVQAAIKGVLGMMRFGNHQSPVLLEALGWLMAHRNPVRNEDQDAKLLGARAFLQASYLVTEPKAKEAYRRFAFALLLMQTARRDTDTPIGLEKVESDFARELADGDRWYQELLANEKSWIKQGMNPEAEFDRLYDTEPEVESTDMGDGKMTPRELHGLMFRIAIGGVISVIVATILGAMVYVVRSRRRT